MTTFFAMLLRPLMLLKLEALLSGMVRTVKLIPDGRMKSILLMHLWDTDPERWAKERDGLIFPRIHTDRHMRWIARGIIAGQWVRAVMGRARGEPHI